MPLGSRPDTCLVSPVYGFAHKHSPLGPALDPSTVVTPPAPILCTLLPRWVTSSAARVASYLFPPGRLSAQGQGPLHLARPRYLLPQLTLEGQPQVFHLVEKQRVSVQKHSRAGRAPVGKHGGGAAKQTLACSGWRGALQGQGTAPAQASTGPATRVQPCPSRSGGLSLGLVPAR